MTKSVDPALQARARQACDRSISRHHPSTPQANAETLARLERAVLHLPRLQREILLAVRLDDLTYAEIAERTGLSAVQVERQFRRGLSTYLRLMRAGRLGWRERWLGLW